MEKIMECKNCGFKFEGCVTGNLDDSMLKPPIVKAGFSRKKQRYKCKVCGHFFTLSRQSGRDIAVKKAAVMLHLLGQKQKFITHALGISRTSLNTWLKQADKILAEEYRYLDKACVPEAIEFESGLEFLSDKKTGVKWLLIAFPTEGKSVAFISSINSDRRY